METFFRKRRFRMQAYLLAALLALPLLSCAQNPEFGSQIQVVPDTFSINGGVAGDATFITFLVRLLSQDADLPIPLGDLDIRITSTLRMIDPDGNLSAVSGDSFFTYTTNNQGEVLLTVEVPLGVDLNTDIFLEAGGAVAEKVSVTVTSS